MPEIQTFYSQNERDTVQIAQLIAKQLSFPSCVYLSGELGAGKTTLSKSIIAYLGHEGVVTSPTYNLIQQYQVTGGMVYHMDLYRLEDPAELEFLAVSDLYTEQSLLLIEWPQKAAGNLINPTHTIEIAGDKNERKITLKTEVGYN